MVKIIETNLLYKDTTLMAHQNRVIEANSWDDYCNAIKNYDSKAIKFRSLTSIYGATIPREATIQNLKYDDIHLSCDVITRVGCLAKKLAFLWE